VIVADHQHAQAVRLLGGAGALAAGDRDQREPVGRRLEQAHPDAAAGADQDPGDLADDLDDAAAGVVEDGQRQPGAGIEVRVGVEEAADVGDVTGAADHHLAAHDRGDGDGELGADAGSPARHEAPSYHAAHDAVIALSGRRTSRCTASAARARPCQRRRGRAPLTARCRHARLPAMSRSPAIFVGLGLLAGVAAPATGRADPAPAAAQTDYFAAPTHTGTLTYRKPRSRTGTQRLVIAGLAAATVIAGGIGVGYNLDSRSAADEVSADDELTGKTWTADREATYQRAGSSGDIAVVAYITAAVFAGATATAWLLTDPGDEVMTVPSTAARPVVAPVAGGALVGGAWRW
jgi:hypothetical protein